MSATLAREMTVLERRAKVVDLAKTGMNYRAIAAEVGYKSPASVAEQIAAWAAETRPSAEATEELRKLQWSRLEDLVATLRPRVMGPLMGMFGPVKGEDGEFIIVPQPQVIDRLMKVYDRQARLMGLDLQPGLSVHVTVSAEQMAAVLWGADDAAVDVDAVEVVQDADA